jgi:hypothetical protein
VLDVEGFRSDAPVVGQQRKGLELLLDRGAVRTSWTFRAVPRARLHIVLATRENTVRWRVHERDNAATECLVL